MPSRQRKAWCICPPGKSALPTTSPKSLIHVGNPKSPPNVPISVITPRSQKKGCDAASPGRFDEPVTCPLLFAHCAIPTVPPSVPRSIMVPFFQRKGCAVGKPVVGFGIESMNEVPTTSSLRSLLQSPATNESGPPSVPRSRITPFFQRNTCVGEGNG